MKNNIWHSERCGGTVNADEVNGENKLSHRLSQRAFVLIDQIGSTKNKAHLTIFIP